MQKWEYLEVFLDSSYGVWQDSMGRNGQLAEMRKPRGFSWKPSAGLLNELGAQGWELTGISGAVLYLKRPSTAGTGG
jgi:hypothetical protein